MNGPGHAPARVIAIVPAHNEAPRIAAVVRAVLVHLPVLVVDDGSDDGTAQVARSAGADVLEEHPNAGKGAALRAGFRVALDRGYDGALTLDGDGQHDPADAPALVAAFGVTPGGNDHIGRHPDLVVGRRDFRRMPPARRLANTLGGFVLSRAVGATVPDNQSGYRLVGRRLMEACLASAEPGFAFEVEMLATCIARRWPVAWVPIRTIYAGSPSHIRPVAHLRTFLRSVATARRTVRRARIQRGSSETTNDKV